MKLSVKKTAIDVKKNKHTTFTWPVPKIPEPNVQGA